METASALDLVAKPGKSWLLVFVKSLISVRVLTVLAVLLLLTAIVVYPLWQLVHESIRGQDGAFTFANYVAAFGESRHILAFVNAIKLGIITAILAAVIAVPLAWGVSRTTMPGRKLVHMAVVATFLIPPFVGAIGWILLGGRNAGWLNKVWMAVTGMDSGPVNIFSFTGFVFVVALYTFPLIYIFTKSALDLVSTELEEAASIMGAGAIKATLLITLPLVMPSILGSTVLVFLEVLGLYGTAALIGIPAGYNVVTTQLAAFFSYPLRIEVAAAFSMPLIGITIVMLAIQRFLLKKKGYAVVTGKAGNRTPQDIGAWGFVLLAYAVLVSLLSFVLPLFTIVVGAISKNWSVGLSLSNLTLNNLYQAIVAQDSIRQSLFNTIHYALFTATLCTALGFAIAYIVQRRLVPFTNAIAVLALSPFAIPGIVLATCFYAAYAAEPFTLYGTAMIIIMAFMARSLPIAFVGSRSAIDGLHPELEEAVRIAGGTPASSLRHVTLPILKKALFGGWLLIFVITCRELSTAMFLTAPNTRVLSILMVEMSEEGQYELLCATAFLLVALTAFVCFLGSRLLGRDFMIMRK